MRILFVVLLSLFPLVGKTTFVNQVLAAEEYPVKPVTFIAAVEPGADGDVLARPLCQKVSALMGKPVIIVNKPGAGGSMGFREIHDAKPDGYTIGLGFTALATNRLLGTLPYDYRAFTIIGGYATIVPVILGSTKTKRPFKGIEEVLSFAKANPGDVSIATSGKGYLWWFTSVAFQDTTGLKFNIIPQPGGAGFTTSQVAGGHVDLGVMGFGPAKSQVEAGNIRVLAVFGSTRAPAPINHVPSLKELGHEVNIVSPHFVLGPAKMPPAVTNKLIKVFDAFVVDL